MAALVVLAVANGREPLGAVPTLVGLLARVSTHVHQEVALLSENLTAARLQALEQVVT